MTGPGARGSHHETRQRRAVLHVLAQAHGFLSAQELHAHLRQAGQVIALSTVYRALHVYAAVGRVGISRDTAGKQLFRLASISGHSHYYLVCRCCGDSISIDARTPEDWAATVAAEHEFTDIHPLIELTGLCPACTTATP